MVDEARLNIERNDEGPRPAHGDAEDSRDRPAAENNCAEPERIGREDLNHLMTIGSKASSGTRFSSPLTNNPSRRRYAASLS